MPLLVQRNDGETVDTAASECMAVRMALATAAHHSSQRVASAATQTEYVAPAPVVEHRAPDPAIHAAPAPVVEYVAPVFTLIEPLLEPLVPQVVDGPVPQIVEKIQPLVSNEAPTLVVELVAPAQENMLSVIPTTTFGPPVATVCLRCQWNQWRLMLSRLLCSTLRRLQWSSTGHLRPP